MHDQAVSAGTIAQLPASPKRLTGRLDRNLVVRVCVVFVALAILYSRMPTTFTAPVFWGEDIGFFSMSRLHGWTSIFTSMAGYLVFVQFLVAILASYISPVAGPTIYNYVAILLTLIVVWLVTSPRLEMPYRPLLAIAVVVVPMGYEELGTITNIQWILPIGVFVLMFMRASPSRTVLAAEAILVALSALSGPFSLFLAPLFLWRLLTARNVIERRRLMVLTAVVGLGALTQLYVIASNLVEAIDSTVPIPYPWTLWINLPFTQIMTTFGPAWQLFHRVPGAVFDGVPGFVTGSLLLAAALTLACTAPYRAQKLFMLFFALAIMFSGMYKFRAALAGQSGGQRYFYVAAVFSLWFICCLTELKYWRTAAAIFVTYIEIALLPVVARTPRVTHDFEWPVWARYIKSGLPIIIPNTPYGFYLGFSASTTGPLSGFRDWLGQDITHLAHDIDQTYCKGDLGRIVPLNMVNLQTSDDTQRLKPGWVTSGSAWDISHNRPVQLVVLVDQNDKVTGFGLPGFKQSSEEAVFSAPTSGWNSIFFAAPGSSVHAYGVTDDGKRLCPLANVRGFPSADLALASEQWLGISVLLPGKAVRQRFKPSERLEGISARLVNFGHQPSTYNVSWRIAGTGAGHSLELGSGTIDASTVGDWQFVELPLSLIPKDRFDEIEVSFRADTDVPPASPIGFPLYRPVTDANSPPAEIGGVPAANGGQLDLRLSYSP